MPNTITVEKDVIFHADIDTVHAVILDTEHYPHFIQSIVSAKVIHKRQDESEVSFKAKLALFSFDYSIKTTKLSASHITFQQHKGFFSLLHGEWRLKAVGGTVEGHYVVHVTLPPLVSGRIVKKAINLYFPNMLNDFKNEIENRFKGG
tara:strand:+ start:179 stop:622 length:444 start_codon:yes stop_codon:yes gene_type:complete